MEYSNEYVKKLFDSSETQVEILRKLNKKINGSGWRLIKKLADQIGLDLKEYNKKITKEKYNRSPKHCACCGKELTYEQKDNIYCSRSCAASINNRGVIRNTNGGFTNGRITNLEAHVCLNCGAELPNNKKKKFCSQECLNDYRYKEAVQKIKSGENLMRGASGVSKYLKMYLMEIHNNKCEKCGWGEEHPVTHTIPLEVHHIDGDCTNNKLENLQLLCPNCHCLTENFGSLNKNSKRFHRRKNRLDD